MLPGTKGYYRASNSVTSSLVITMCSGTSWKELSHFHCTKTGKKSKTCWKSMLKCRFLLTSCSVMLIRSSCWRNCSRMYFGAMSTRDWNMKDKPS